MTDQSIIISHAPPAVDDLARLYVEAGFVTEINSAKLQQAIEGTARWYCARLEPEQPVLGTGRILTDWARYACVYDVIVAQVHQRRGIGTAIMQAILRDALQAGIDVVHLWPSKGKVPFYERLGFYTLSSEQPVMKLNKRLVSAEGVYQDNRS
jgi:GNAT superfamily N-acetyltransferase